MSLATLPENRQIIKDFNSNTLTAAVERIKTQMADTLLVNEVFSTIQCEGESMGMPVVFIRTYGCNLKCGFSNPESSQRGCDTPYTWKASATEESDKNRYTPKMLVDEIMQHASHGHWVITGGEPLLQGDRFLKMFEEYKSRTGTYPHVEFETNGTMIPSDRLDQFIQEHGHYNVSTKLENSNATEATGYTPDEEEYNWNTRERRIKPLAMKFFTENKKAYFKFVIDSKLHALKEVKGLQTEFNIPNNKVWIMPEGMSPEDINAGALPLIEVCKAEGYRFSTRLHILVWGYLRGV